MCVAVVEARSDNSSGGYDIGHGLQQRRREDGWMDT